MLGAHLDSWHGGTGATDNGAGSVVVDGGHADPEGRGRRSRAARSASGSGPARSRASTARAAYVDQHFASRPPMTAEEKELPWYLQQGEVAADASSPSTRSSSAYFNLDNGTGKIRGIYGEDNAGVVPIFEAWLAALPRPRRDDRHDEPHRRHGPRVLRRRGPARVPVHPGRARLRDAHAPHEHGPLRAARRRTTSMQASVVMARLRLQRGHARRHAAAQAHADGGARTKERQADAPKPAATPKRRLRRP